MTCTPAALTHSDWDSSSVCSSQKHAVKAPGGDAQGQHGGEKVSAVVITEQISMCYRLIMRQTWTGNIWRPCRELSAASTLLILHWGALQALASHLVSHIDRKLNVHSAAIEASAHQMKTMTRSWMKRIEKHSSLCTNTETVSVDWWS